MSIKKNPFKLAVIISTIVCFVCEIIWYFDFFANYGVAYDITTLVHLIPPEIAMTVILVSTLMNKTKVALIATGILYATYFLVSIPSFIDTINGIVTFCNVYDFTSKISVILGIFEYLAYIIFAILIFLFLFNIISYKATIFGLAFSIVLIATNTAIYPIIQSFTDGVFYINMFRRLFEWIAICTLTICVVHTCNKSYKQNAF